MGPTNIMCLSYFSSLQFALFKTFVKYYDQLTVADALRNPSSFNAFSQHVHFRNDRRLGKEVLRPGY